MLSMPPDQLVARVRELLAHPKPTGATMLQIEKLLPEVLDTLERYKRERDYYQNHREELMQMAQKQCADEIEQLKNARVPSEMRCPQCNTLHVDQDEWAHEIPHRKHLCLNCQHIWQPYIVATVGVDFHIACRERADRIEADIAWMRSAWGEAEAEVAKLRERRDKLLELVTKLSQTVPLESEVADALSQRGILLAEIGTLRSQLAEYEPLFQAALSDRAFLDAILAGIHPLLRGPFQPDPIPNTVTGIVDGVRTLRELLDWTAAMQQAYAERNKLLVLMVAELQKTLNEVCDVATTPLPEDRERVLAARKLANKELPPP